VLQIDKKIKKPIPFNRYRFSICLATTYSCKGYDYWTSFRGICSTYWQTQDFLMKLRFYSAWCFMYSASMMF